MALINSNFRVKADPAFIVIEGINGAGKSTLMKGLANLLLQKSKEVVTTREPGGSPLGQKLRELLLSPNSPPRSDLAELLLFAADRAQHVASVIRPALNQGMWVLCDRYLYSTIAFQGYGRGASLATINQINETAVDGCKPDLVILIDLDPAEALKRAAQRKAAEKDAFEKEHLAFHQKIRDGFLKLAKERPEPFLVLNGSESPENLVEQAFGVVI